MDLIVKDSSEKKSDDIKIALEQPKTSLAKDYLLALAFKKKVGSNLFCAIQVLIERNLLEDAKDVALVCFFKAPNIDHIREPKLLFSLVKLNLPPTLSKV